jgi:DNA-binding response OmpR family regulator
MQREPRVVVGCMVEFQRLGKRVVAYSEDIGRHGIFIRTDQFLPVGEVIELTLAPPQDSPIVMIARVAHVLSHAAARALGRSAGMGMEFLEQDPQRREQLRRFVEDLRDVLTPPPREMPTGVTVLAVDSNLRMLERLSDALGRAGFNVNTAANGAEAYSACLNAAPDVIVAADKMLVMDGWKLFQLLSARPRLCDIPMVLLSDDPGDMTRLNAYRLGVADFIQKPFTDDELGIRVRRVLRHPRGSAAERSALRGDVATIGLGTLLSLFDFERKSGMLVLMNDAELARLFFAFGRVVKVESTAGGDSSQDKLMKVLDWQSGNFEFTACEVVGEDEIKKPTQQVLLEHAKQADDKNEKK